MSAQSIITPARSSKRTQSTRTENISDARKRRWSADERAERGRPPRRSSGRSARPARRTDRPVPESSLDQMTWVEPVAAAPSGAQPTTPVDGGFAALGVPAALVESLGAAGITTPFPIQAQTIPDALTGRDVLGRARTGSGKTLAFGLPMIVRLSAGSRPSGQPSGIVLVPTRELALQVADVLAPLSRSRGLRVALVTGGMSYGPQIRAFATGTDIVVATPGRLIDLMEQGVADLGRVEITVLDEADHMADLGFMPAVTEILAAVPTGGQRLLFSATLDRAVDRLVRDHLVDPIIHRVDPDQASITTMDHRLVEVAPTDKVLVTADLVGRAGRTIVFVRTQRGADRIADQLRASGVLAGALHGGLTQGARARILAAFKDGRLPVLVATDVAARGIHVDSVDLVLQADPPNGPKEYLHRAGRTARAGASGQVLTLVLPPQRRDVRRLLTQAGVTARTVPGRSGEHWLAEIGPRADHAAAITRGEFDRLTAPPERVRGPGARRRPRNAAHRQRARAR